MKKQPNKPHIEKIEITKHAIAQYKARVNNYPDHIVEDVLREIVKNGTILKTRNCIKPKTDNINVFNICIEFNMVYRKIGVVVVYEDGIATVVTCTGDEVMRHWYRKVEVMASYYSKATY